MYAYGKIIIKTRPCQLYERNIIFADYLVYNTKLIENFVCFKMGLDHCSMTYYQLFVISSSWNFKGIDKNQDIEKQNMTRLSPYLASTHAPNLLTHKQNTYATNDQLNQKKHLGHEGLGTYKMRNTTQQNETQDLIHKQISAWLGIPKVKVDAP